MRPIPVGAKGTYTLRVAPAHLASQFKDAALPPVFATPMMVTAMENAALNAVREYLDPGESAVGTLVNVRHLAATPAGHWVTAQADAARNGMTNMSQRMDEIGGFYTLASQPGSGCRVEFTVPLSQSSYSGWFARRRLQVEVPGVASGVTAPPA